jgi:hypothetical protein
MPVYKDNAKNRQLKRVGKHYGKGEEESFKKGSKSKTHKGDKDFTSKRGSKDHHIEGHDVRERRAPYEKEAAGGAREEKGRKDRRRRKNKVSGMETIKLRKSKGAEENENITFKKGALHRALKFDGTFSKSEIARMDRVEDGTSFKFKGNSFRMTPLMKKRVSLAKTMMSWKK